MHALNLNNYAFGWVVTEGQEWANGPVIWHNGSNTSWYTMLAMFPGLNTAMVVNSNHGRVDRAELAAWNIIKQMALAVKNTQASAQLGTAKLSHSGDTDTMIAKSDDFRITAQ